MASMIEPGAFADNVIDLTGLDDEPDNWPTPPTRHTTLQIRPSSASQTRVIDTARSHHGLLLPGDFGREVVTPSTAGLKRPASFTFGNLAKRQRVAGAYVNKSLGEGYLELPRGGNLKDVLRYQVFPHINKCLRPYGQQLDDTTRKEIGKRVATAVCEVSFTNNLMRNNGRLTSDFERKIEAKCKLLIDELAGRALHDAPGNIPAHVKNAGGFKSPAQKPLPIVILLDDSSSEDEAEAHLESLALEVSSPESYRTCASSRATSFSTETLPERAASTERNHIDIEAGPIITPRRSARRTKAIVIADEPMVLPVARLAPPLLRRPVQSSSVAIRNRIHGSQRNIPATSIPTPSISKRLEIERLRLAGLDSETSRPYLPLQARLDIERGLSLHANGALTELSQKELKKVTGRVLHVDFIREEVRCLAKAVESALGIVPSKPSTSSKEYLRRLITGWQGDVPRMVKSMKVGQLPVGRTKSDVTAFLQDIQSPGISVGQPEILRFKPVSCQPNKAVSAANSISSVLRYRESGGRRYLGHGFEGTSIKNIVASLVEDTFVKEAEWTDCSGDVWAMAWIPGDRFICGAITHSDSHNQQYNKPGNLLVGSVANKTLTSISGHRIPRPIVTSGENSLNAMRETQDPWLYCTVTSAAYDCFSKKCFTGSYDRTVKVWDVTSDGLSMDLCGVWEHQGVVNFVVTSPHHGRVATASDFCQDAIRVYDLDEENISESVYHTFSGGRANEQFLERTDSLQIWAYYPATIQWGKASGVAHLLLAGYSPRTYDANTGDIPEDKMNTGELCLWNTDNGNCIPVTSARTANVFEVLWHPTQPIFLASTSATGDFDDGVMTQIRLFGQTVLGTFSHLKTLDCPGIDINEITCMPNSSIHCYVTASCTDGKTYVWDTAQEDKPIHVLSHSVSIDNPDNNLNSDDNGVKFAAWGRSVNRFYTGSSDGVVKSWDVRAPAGQELVQDVVTLSGGISQGQFSPDCSKLLLGDSTGKVHLLTVESSLEPGEEKPTCFRNPIKPHREPPPPMVDENDMEIDPEPSAKQLAKSYVDQGQIRIIKDEYIGAVQGRKYASTCLFCPPEQHDPDWRKHQEKRLYPKKSSFSTLPTIESSSSLQHQKNLWQDNHQIKDLDPETRLLLDADQVDFDFETDYKFDLEPEFQVFNKEEEKMEEEEKTELRIDRYFLDPEEIQEFSALKKKISQELDVQIQLENLRIDLVETIVDLI